MSLEIVRLSEAELSLTLRRQVLLLQEQAWPSDAPPDFTNPALVHDPTLHPISMLLVDGTKVVAALDILSKQIEHSGTTFRASGLSTVVTDAQRRGQGHGARLVTAAREFIASTNADLGLFTCDPPLANFYTRCGWQVLPGCVLIGGTPDDPLASDSLGKVTLGAFFSPHGQQHASAFLHARVALYPGEIDRLW